MNANQTDKPAPASLWTRFNADGSIVGQWDFEPFPPEVCQERNVIRYDQSPALLSQLEGMRRALEENTLMLNLIATLLQDGPHVNKIEFIEKRIALNGELARAQLSAPPQQH